MGANLSKHDVSYDCSEDEFDMCAICWCDMDVENECHITQCGHKYHKNCLETWTRMKQNCPVCRYNFPPETGRVTPRDNGITDSTFVAVNPQHPQFVSSRGEQRSRSEAVSDRLYYLLPTGTVVHVNPNCRYVRNKLYRTTRSTGGMRVCLVCDSM